MVPCGAEMPGCCRVLGVLLSVVECVVWSPQLQKKSEGRFLSLPYEMTSNFRPEIFVKSSSSRTGPPGDRAEAGSENSCGENMY